MSHPHEERLKPGASIVQVLAHLCSEKLTRDGGHSENDANDRRHLYREAPLFVQKVREVDGDHLDDSRRGAGEHDLREAL